MRKITLAAAAVMALSTAVMAGGNVAPIETVVAVTPWTGFYAGLGATANQTYLVENADWFSTSNLNKTAYGLQGQAGYTFFNNGDFAVSGEAKLGSSFAGDDFVETFYYGAYIKPQVIFNAFSIYALAGYGSVEYTATERANEVNYAVSTSVDGFTYGAGFEYGMADNVSFFAEYVVQPSLDRADITPVAGGIVISEDSIETDVIAVGVNYRF